MTNNDMPRVSIHTLVNTSPEKRAAVLDHGKFVDDLAVHGLSVLVSSKDTFLNGAVAIPKNNHDQLVFDHSVIDPLDISAMHVRPLASVQVSGSELVPKLNANEVKSFSSSKFRLYSEVLSSYQVQTQLLTMDPADYATSIAMLDNLSSPRVIIKSNSGAGGSSTKTMTKAEAARWITDHSGSSEVKPQILQPEIMFGALPDGIKGATKADNEIVERARKESLLSELRLFVVKRAGAYDTIPVLRVVQDKNLKMEGSNDVYVDIELPEELSIAVATIGEKVIDTLCEKAGNIGHALGAIDFYFDKQGVPHIMEANFRSPELPTTRHNPLSGRAVHLAVAQTLADMVESKGY